MLVEELDERLAVALAPSPFDLDGVIVAARPFDEDPEDEEFDDLDRDEGDDNDL